MTQNGIIHPVFNECMRSSWPRSGKARNGQMKISDPSQTVPTAKFHFKSPDQCNEKGNRCECVGRFHFQVAGEVSQYAKKVVL